MNLPSSFQEYRELLDDRYRKYAHKLFVNNDPIQIPHRFRKPQDIEISGILAATIAWGNRKSIINSMDKLLHMLGNSPHEFVINFKPSDTKFFKGFVHRTFNEDDAIAFITVLNNIYTEKGGLKKVFVDAFNRENDIKTAINGFRKLFCQSHIPQRTLKHVPNVTAGSAAKRLNMFLRWMVRPNTEGIDFGIWNGIPTSALLIPLDVHSARVSRTLGLLNRAQNDMKAVEELTAELKRFDPIDPVKYDFALFGMGVYGDT